MKTILTSIVIAALFVGLVGCGKSEAQKKREAARQKITEAVAGLKVCTGGSTYNEFRQAEMNLRTSFEINKSSLDDILEDFNRLDAVIAATEYCWKIKNYSMGVYGTTLSKPDLIQMQVVNPSITKNSKLIQMQNGKSFTTYEIEDDPDFQTHQNVRLGLSKISELCGQIQGELK